MISRLTVAALISLATFACSNDLDEGGEIFARECAMCHSWSNTMEMLEDVNLEERPAYLAEFLESHPGILSDEEKKLVIAVLSQPDN